MLMARILVIMARILVIMARILVIWQYPPTTTLGTPLPGYHALHYGYGGWYGGVNMVVGLSIRPSSQSN